ncbi:TIM-barrel domain-containing protein [Glycomyces sp. NPDC049804]|uniref:TIM-barrel domain-containing protein n=1 Tax=Glycomyces sp. NPDC049804 TaxID=3154363 RepID=UPI0034159EDD
MASPRAREQTREICKRNYHDLGIKLFCSAKPNRSTASTTSTTTGITRARTSRSATSTPQAFSRMVYEGQRAADQEAIVNLVSYALAGSQRYGALVWPVDIHSDWADFRRQLTAGVQMGVAGPGSPPTSADSPAETSGTRRTTSSWSAGSSSGRSARSCAWHGDRRPSERVLTADGSPRNNAGAPNQLWSFGEDVYEIPVCYGAPPRGAAPVHPPPHGRGAHQLAASHARHVQGFPRDLICWELAYWYMFGADVLVAPVVRPEATCRRVYLPEGGQRIDAAALLDVIPNFAREGALPEFKSNTSSSRRCSSGEMRSSGAT